MKESLELEPNGDRFTLRRIDAVGKLTEMELSEDNLLALAKSIQSETEYILEKRSRAQTHSASVTAVAQMGLNVDVHWTQIHLLLIDGHGTGITFSLTPFQAQTLVEYLPQWIAKIAQSPKRQP
ncbi:MAG: hypothetical protein ABSH33_18415 [Steroidobacteraceae bacterium]|jgi:hypothetical protein